MKAMILAAGLGTRLRPLTDNLPKALVEINGRTLLEITITRLKSFGVKELIINVHHYAEKIVAYLKSRQSFDLQIAISREDDLLLDTGGGLKKAGWFFLEGDANEPFILHNVDVLSSVDLGRMASFHKEEGALATLAVQNRATSRYLVFDERLQLCSRLTSADPIITPVTEFAGSSQHARALAFSGIHIISPRLLSLMTERGVFSIIESYLRLAAAGERVLAFRADEYYWRDLGRLEDLKQAESDYRNRLIS